MTMQHTGTKPRTTTHAIDTGYYEAALQIKGFVEQDSETYLGELLSLIQAAYGDVYKNDFEEAIVDMYRHVFEREAEEAAKPSEWDLGYEAGKKAGYAEAETDASQVAIANPSDLTTEEIDALPVGSKVIDRDGDTWTREGAGWRYALTPRNASYLVRMYGPVRLADV